MSTTTTTATTAAAANSAAPLTLRPLEPVSLEEAVDIKRNGNATVAYNSILSIAESGIMGYFTNLSDEFDELASALGITPQALAAKSYGEVACEIKGLADLNPLEEYQDGADGYPEKLCTILDAFCRPVLLSALVSWHERERRSFALIKDLDRSKLVSACPENESPSLEDLMSDYFDDHLVARGVISPEGRVVRYFPFEIDDYCEAVSAIGGEGERLRRALAAIDLEEAPSPYSLLYVVKELEDMRQMRKRGWDHEMLDELFQELAEQIDRLDEPDQEDSQEEPEEIQVVEASDPALYWDEWDDLEGIVVKRRWQDAYAALYLLFVQPFAVAYQRYSNHTP